MARSSLTKYLLKLDRFGHRMEMHYQGSATYQTLFGSLVTVLTYVLILINLVTIFSAFINNDNQTEVIRRINIDL